MADLLKEAERAVEKLLEGEDEQLYEQLGIRAKAIAEDPKCGGVFEPDVAYDGVQMGLMEDVREFGRRIFQRWNAEAYKLVCGSDPNDKEDREEVLKAFGVGDVAAGAALATLLVTHLGLAPALAAVISALVVKRFFQPAHEEFCEVWKKNVRETE